jgi:hypothetical protein
MFLFNKIIFISYSHNDVTSIRKDDKIVSITYNPNQDSSVDPAEQSPNHEFSRAVDTTKVIIEN